MRHVVVLLSTTCLSGCYYVQAARGQLEVINKREPIDEVIAAPDTPADIAARLELVREARQFAVDELLLPDNDSYLSYADLGRDYVVWNVFAAPEFSLEPKSWCFPIAGCVNYRGYFAEASANDKAEDLREQGYDVVVGGVPAYSTLGRFDDPVLNTMMHWSDADLVATIFHELAHQRLYVKDDTTFNESFASAVAEIGLERWLTARAEHDAFDAWAARRDDRRRVIALIDEARADLEALYASSMSPHEMRRGKQVRFERLASELPEEFKGDLNNARLASLALYESRLPEFLALLDECDGRLSCFFERAEALAN